MPLGNGRQHREVPFEAKHAWLVWLIYLLLTTVVTISMHRLLVSSEVYREAIQMGGVSVLFVVSPALRELFLTAMLAVPISLGVVFFAQVLINRFGYAYMELKDVLLIATFCSFPFFVVQLANFVWFSLSLGKLTDLTYTIYTPGGAYLLPIAILWFGIASAMYLIGFKKVKLGQAIFSIVSGFIFTGVISYFLMDKF